MIYSPLKGSLFLHGPAGTGKTSAGVARLRHLVDSGIPAEHILVIVPQRSLAEPYYDEIHRPDFPAGGTVSILTLGGLAQRMISLFWPIIAGPAGFGHLHRAPVFLTLETAQYYLAGLVKPLLEQGFFETIHLDRNRLLSQILDNLNKSAAVGFPHTLIGERLKAAWIGKPEQQHVYDETQDCVNRFRTYCLENNLLDFSLQLEIFVNHLWPSFLVREYLFSSYRHLIFDNIEEDIPVAHDILSQWLGRFDSALCIYDTGGGYRSFLGADPQTGWQLQASCDQVTTFSTSWVISPEMEDLRTSFSLALKNPSDIEPSPFLRSVVQVTRQPYYPTLLTWITSQIVSLVQKGVRPGEIAVLAPFLSDSLRFSLMDRLTTAGIPSRSHRPSRSLREEPATHCLLTMARLAHPQWNLACSHFDVRMAFMQSIQDLDLVRADVLSRIVFRPNRMQEGLGSFDHIQSEKQERISYLAGQRFETLRLWLEDYRQNEPVELDIFLSRLFGEVLSQPGFGFHQSFDQAAVAARLIESVQKFRKAAVVPSRTQDQPIGLDYIQMVVEGVIAAQYLQNGTEQDLNSVFIAPAYTFLMANKPAEYQFWLDIGSMGWWERLYQPLTHPVVLSRHWDPGRIWTDADEYATNQEALDRLLSGLIRRCRYNVYLCSSALNEQGDEPRGPLLQVVQAILRKNPGLEVNYASQA